MDKYADYYYDDETEERVQVSQAICENEEDIAEAIERSKRELKESSVPYGYRKLDEQIITTVYKLPENEVIHCSHDNNYKYGKYSSNQEYNYYSEQKQKSNTYSNEEEDSGTIYNFNNITKNHGYYQGKSPIINNSYSAQYKSSKYNYNYNDNNQCYNKNKKYNYRDINGNKIENYVENKVSQDGEYLVSMTLSKKLPYKGENFMGKGRFRNNYRKEEIEVDENDVEDIEYDGKKRNIITKTHAQSIEFPSSGYS
jgi:hypothetical protein